MVKRRNRQSNAPTPKTQLCRQQTEAPPSHKGTISEPAPPTIIGFSAAVLDRMKVHTTWAETKTGQVLRLLETVLWAPYGIALHSKNSWCSEMLSEGAASCSINICKPRPSRIFRAVTAKLRDRRSRSQWGPKGPHRDEVGVQDAVGGWHQRKVHDVRRRPEPVRCLQRKEESGSQKNATQRASLGAI